jgi:L,D-transpeptidase ErfK/SrfK
MVSEPGGANSFRRVLVCNTVAMMKILPTVAAAALLSTMALPNDASARAFPLAPGQTAVGDIGHVTTKYEDTLLDVARTSDIGYTQLVIANRGVDAWIPGRDTKIVLPQFYLLPKGPRRGIVINLAEQRLFYFPPGGHTVETFPIGVGVQGWNTPLGATEVVEKQVHPGWSPPASIRAEKPELPSYVPPGPDNPLGDYAMRLGWKSYLIHGTNLPDGVGRNSSHGCVRMYPEDIDHLFHSVGVGVLVRVVNDEVVAAWVDKELYVAVFPSKEQTDQIDIEQPWTEELPANLIERVTEEAGDAANQVDWDLVKQAGMERTGMPISVTHIAAVATSTSTPVTTMGAPPNAAPAAEEEPDSPVTAEAPSTAAGPEPDLPVTMVATPSTAPTTKAVADQDGKSADDAATINRVLDSFPAK